MCSPKGLSRSNSLITGISIKAERKNPEIYKISVLNALSSNNYF